MQNLTDLVAGRERWLVDDASGSERVPRQAGERQPCERVGRKALAEELDRAAGKLVELQFETVPLDGVELVENEV